MSKVTLLACLLLLFLPGCSHATPGQGQSAASPSSPLTGSGDSQQSLVVFAAASLTSAFGEIAHGFESAHPGVAVSFNFAGSQILRAQLEQGASADIFASADHKNMELLIDEHLIAGDSYQDFATNRLVVILPPGNPGQVMSLTDLARDHLKLILADASVPAGSYARQVIEKLSQQPGFGKTYVENVMANVVSNETDVKQVVAKVELGEADAGIVYVSDTVAAPDLSTIPIPDPFNVSAAYPIAITASAADRTMAEAFIAYVLSPAGQAILSQWGFIPVTK